MRRHDKALMPSLSLAVIRAESKMPELRFRVPYRLLKKEVANLTPPLHMSVSNFNGMNVLKNPVTS